MNWYLEVLRKYAKFSGRARRREYWQFVLFNLLALLGLLIVDLLLNETLPAWGGLFLVLAYSAFTLIPSLAVNVRRLHDVGLNGYWIFLAIIPVLGSLLLLIFMIKNSQPGSNRFGPNPKEYAFW
ncbi:MAG: DUF805 domain-containing protein [Limnobacter sp.]|nr:DUF805 domain-containing protein [Limnobacter sp.]